jgi:haloalkane dehalogenase
MTTQATAYRTPDERFENLPGWDHQPLYRDWDGLRLAHYEIGPADGPLIVLFHGEPTWSYLYRKVVPELVSAGCRCVLQDQPGFGRSDKPTEIGWYSYERHTAAALDFVDHLGVDGATFVVHDWGGPIGLRAAVDRPGSAARVVILDTGLFTGHQRMTDAWRALRDFVERTEDLPIELLIRGACAADPGDDVLRGYAAPYPVPESKAGTRAFPLMIPTAPEEDGAAAGQAVLEAIAASDVPKLVLWADGDPIIPLKTGHRFAAAIGAPEPEVVENASHFLQEDQGERIGRRIAAWLGEQGA